MFPGQLCASDNHNCAPDKVWINNRAQTMIPNADVYIVLSKYLFRAHANFNGKAYVPVEQSISVNTSRTVIHEFGHAFGYLADEYVESVRGDHPWYPNCANTMEQAKKWWSNLIGQGAETTIVDYFNGCNYTSDNIKPTRISLMDCQYAGLCWNKYGMWIWPDFGPVNIRQIKRAINNWQPENLKYGIDCRYENYANTPSCN